MNTKIILGLGSSLLLASSLVAISPQSDMGQNTFPSCKQKNNSTCKQKKMHKQHTKGHKRGNNIVKMFQKLNLSDEQRTQIRTIVEDNMKDMPNPHSSFSDTNFNKDEFIKLAKQKKENALQRKAELIEKVYSVLSKSQKKDFKTMLDMRDIMQKNKKMRKSCE